MLKEQNIIIIILNDAGLAISRSQVRRLILSSATPGKLITLVPLSPSSIIWYQPMGGDALWLGR